MTISLQKSNSRPISTTENAPNCTKINFNTIFELRRTLQIGFWHFQTSPRPSTSEIFLRNPHFFIKNYDLGPISDLSKAHFCTKMNFKTIFELRRTSQMLFWTSQSSARPSRSEIFLTITPIFIKKLNF